MAKRSGSAKVAHHQKMAGHHAKMALKHIAHMKAAKLGKRPKAKKGY